MYYETAPPNANKHLVRQYGCAMEPLSRVVQVESGSAVLPVGLQTLDGYDVHAPADAGRTHTLAHLITCKHCARSLHHQPRTHPAASKSSTSRGRSECGAPDHQSHGDKSQRQVAATEIIDQSRSITDPRRVDAPSAACRRGTRAAGARRAASGWSSGPTRATRRPRRRSR